MTGLATATEVASPVSPVLVLLDCELTAPEAPDVAVGVTVAEAAPPAPPLAEAVETEAPPAAMTEPSMAATEDDVGRTAREVESGDVDVGGDSRARRRRPRHRRRRPRGR